jgi:opine dehydrogenase
MGLKLPGVLDVLLTWYGHLGAKGSTAAEVMSTNPAYEIAWAPQTLNHRFITEDVPFGIVPIEALGLSAGVPTPTISSLITLSSDLLGVDFRAQGRDLGRLGLSGLTPEQVRRLVEEGEQ